MTSRYTARRRKYPSQVSETDWQRTVTDLASRLGWRWMHVRKSMYGKEYHLTSATGPLGRGWPDLILVKPGRIIAAELKRQGSHPTDDQLRVLSELSAAGAEAYVWMPSDLDAVQRILEKGAPS